MFVSAGWAIPSLIPAASMRQLRCEMARFLRAHHQTSTIDRKVRAVHVSASFAAEQKDGADDLLRLSATFCGVSSLPKRK